MGARTTLAPRGDTAVMMPVSAKEVQFDLRRAGGESTSISRWRCGSLRSGIDSERVRHKVMILIMRLMCDTRPPQPVARCARARCVFVGISWGRGVSSLCPYAVLSTYLQDLERSNSPGVTRYHSNF